VVKHWIGLHPISLIEHSLLSSTIPNQNLILLSVVYHKDRYWDLYCYVNGTTVEMVAKEKDLGITITKDLTWNNHLKAIVSKVNRKMGFFKRNCFALLNTKTCA